MCVGGLTWPTHFEQPCSGRVVGSAPSVPQCGCSPPRPGRPGHQGSTSAHCCRLQGSWSPYRGTSSEAAKHRWPNESEAAAYAPGPPTHSRVGLKVSGHEDLYAAMQSDAATYHCTHNGAMQQGFGKQFMPSSQQMVEPSAFAFPTAFGHHPVLAVYILTEKVGSPAR